MRLFTSKNWGGSCLECWDDLTKATTIHFENEDLDAYPPGTKSHCTASLGKR
jgi:hypothetical protein